MVRKFKVILTITIPRMQNQTQTTPVSLPRMSADTATPNALASMGKALETTADTIGKAVEQEVARQDTANFTLKTSDYNIAKQEFLYGTKDKDGNVVNPGLMHTVGQDAVKPADGIPLEQKAADWHKQYTDSVIESLPTQRQKDAYRQHVTADKDNILGAVKQHEWDQSQVVVKTNADAAVLNNTNALISAATDDNVSMEIYDKLEEDLKNSIRARAAVVLGSGATPTTDKDGNKVDNLAVKEQIDKTMGKVFTAAAITYVQKGDYQAARDALEASVESGYLTPGSTEHANLLHRVEAAEATGMGTEFAGKVWVQPEENAPVTNHVEMFKQIEDAVKNKTITKEAGRVAETELSQKISRYNADASANIHQFTASVWDGIDKKTLTMKSAFNRIDSSNLPGTERVSLKKQVEHYFKPPPNPEAAAIRRDEQNFQLGEMIDKINRGELRVKSLSDAMGYTGTIGRQNVTRLAGYGQKYEAALANPPLASQQFDIEIDTLRNAGIKIPEAKMDGKVNPEYSAMKGYILDALVTTQSKAGKLLNEEETKKAIRAKIESEVPVYMEGKFFGFKTSSVENKKPWNVQKPESIDVGAYLKGRLGRPPTQAEIDSARKELFKPSTNRTQIKKRVPFGGIE